MATKAKEDVLNRVWRMIRDVGDTAAQQLLTDTEIYEIVDDALRTYSLSRPRLITVDLDADGTDSTALPTSQNGWVEDFSAIHSVETPTGANPPNYVDFRKFGLYYAPPQTGVGSNITIRWLIESPGSGTHVRVVFTGIHTYGVASTDTTVPDIDFGGVCALAASLAAVAIQSGMARTHEPIVSADMATYRTKSMEWASVAKAWREVYDRHMASARRPASGNVNWDTRMVAGYAHLTHDRWRR